MSERHYWIPGIPKAQPRAKARAWTPKGGGTPRASVYNPGTSAEWKATIAIALRDSMPETPILGGVSSVMVFYFPRPKSHFGTGRNAEKLKASAPKRHLKKPDRENLEKPVLDVLTQLGFWRDDSQSDRGSTAKRYADDGQKPGLALTLHWETDR